MSSTFSATKQINKKKEWQAKPQPLEDTVAGLVELLLGIGEYMGVTEPGQSHGLGLTAVDLAPFDFIPTGISYGSIIKTQPYLGIVGGGGKIGGGIGIAVVLEGALAIGPVVIAVFVLHHVHDNPIVLPVKPGQLLAVAGAPFQHLTPTENVGFGECHVALRTVNGDRRRGRRRWRRLWLVGHCLS